MERLISLLGRIVCLGFAYSVSYDRLDIRCNTVPWGLGWQFILASFILKTPFGLALFEFLGNTVRTFLDYSDVGAKFVFGENFKDHFIAFKVLPTIIFFASFIAILYHDGISPRIVSIISQIMMRTMKISGAETLSCASNMFVGCTEAPLMIKPYINTLTLSELHAIMTGGFATIAGGVMAAYIAMGISPTHLISASVMSAPAALAISKIMYPETDQSETKNEVIIELKSPYTNAIDAAINGALEGLKLALNVGAMLIAILGLVAFINGILVAIGQPWGLSNLSLELIFSYLLAPVAWLMGVPWQDCLQVGIWLGKKTILNEFIAYLDLQNLITENTMSPRSQIIATYALCGFSNLGTIGLQIGGITAIAPNRHKDLAKLGLRTMIAGSLACFLTACIAGLLL